MASKKKSENPLKPVLFNQVSLAGGFWGPRIDVNRTVTLPIEYEHLSVNLAPQPFLLGEVDDDVPIQLV